MKRTWTCVMALAAFAAAAVMTGCRSKKAPDKLKDYTAVPLYMAGQEIPGDDQEKYLYNGSVKMYSVGRLVDPGTGTMREAGTVYRVESAPRWNLMPQYDANPESFARKQLQQQYSDSMAGHIQQTLVSAREVSSGLNCARQEIRQLEARCAELQKNNAELLKLIRKEQNDRKTAVQNMQLMQKYIQRMERRVEDLRMQNFRGRK